MISNTHNTNEMADRLDAILQSIMDECFPIVTKRFKKARTNMAGRRGAALINTWSMRGTTS